MSMQKIQLSVDHRQYIADQIISGKTYAEVADELGVSRQRVQQLNKPDKEVIGQLKIRSQGCCEQCGMPLVHGHAHHISGSAPDYHGLSNLLYLCQPCHRRNEPKIPRLNCLICGQSFPRHANQIYCSWECFKKSHHTILTCSLCGKQFEKRNSEYKRSIRTHKISGFFCSKICFGKWTARRLLENAEKRTIVEVKV